MIMSIEAEFRLGLGGYYEQSVDDQARLMAWWQVRADPSGEASKKQSKHEFLAALQAAQRRGGRRG